MKRSEAINKLAEWYKEGNIGGHVFAIPHIDSFSFYIEKSKNILDFIEKEIGMLPPLTKHPDDGIEWEKE